MHIPPNMSTESRLSLGRILPRVKSDLMSDPESWGDFEERLTRHFPQLFSIYHSLYHTRYDFFFHLESLVRALAESWIARPLYLRELDKKRQITPGWFLDNGNLGGVIYVDLFAGDLKGVQAKIPYFQELGLTYLHLMPFFQAPAGENDGGYAVSSYRDVEPTLGSMDQLRELALALNQAGISLVVDLVFNHTSNEHTWARQAIAGSAEHQQIYRIYKDRTEPDKYERTLREIFPDEHAGAFTYFPNIRFLDADGHLEQQGGWVWTTFHSYQWDLNYNNPNTFNQMAGEMLFLANQGVEVIRLDAVAFIWKEMGTSCENLPEAHALIQAFNAVARISAPSLLFKSEAIVHPDDVVKYIDPTECQLSYNPLLMALLWNTLATREVNLLVQALTTRYAINPDCAWVNYVRCHDDIGWTFSDDDAAMFGINGYDHRRFLNDFYLGRFSGSFSKGAPFQENPKTGDCRISGTAASLAGLEKAIEDRDPFQIEMSIRRILLVHAIILTVGGIPLLYLGDEVGTLNDHSYLNDPHHARDSRWIHRPVADEKRYAVRNDASTVPGKVYQGLKSLIELRRNFPAFAGGDLATLQVGNQHVLGYERRHNGHRMVILANFSEFPQSIASNMLKADKNRPMASIFGFGDQPHPDLITLEPYAFVVLG